MNISLAVENNGGESLITVWDYKLISQQSVTIEMQNDRYTRSKDETFWYQAFWLVTLTGHLTFYNPLQFTGNQ